MANKLIRIDGGLLVEVEADGGGPQRIAANAATNVDGALDAVQDLLYRAVEPVTAVWSKLNREVKIEEIEISLAVGFEASGHLFLARGTGSSNVGFKLKVRPREET